MPIDNGTAVFYVASFAFLFAVLFELWRRTHKIRKYHRENPLSDRMEKAIHYFRNNSSHDHITNDIYQELTKVSDATATRDLDKLEELGFLEQRGKTNNTYYLFTTKAGEHKKSHRLTIGSSS